MSSLKGEAIFMREALRLAAKGLGRTSPNPMVGAVLVKRGKILAVGFHSRAGQDHAEIRAIKKVGKRAQGSHLYVNLEPCNHYGRTGPCTQAVIEAGIRRVIVGMRDPNPLVNGKGIAMLRRHGIEVVTGVLEEDCRRLNEAYICYIQNRRPFVTFKTAITLDGRVASRSGDARWVTGEAARRQAHRMRHVADAIMVGVGTILKDDPELTCRGIRNGRDPIRIVVDSRLRTPPTACVVGAAVKSVAPTLIVTTLKAPQSRASVLQAAGAQIVRVEAADDHHRVDITNMLRLLAQKEIVNLLLEGGPSLAGAFWNNGLIDRVVAFLAPKILGDPKAFPMLAGVAVDAMAEAKLLSEIKMRRVGEDFVITGIPQINVRTR